MTTARRLQATTIPAVAAEIERYLSTGDTEASRSAWRSVAFFTPNNIDAVRRKETWDGPAWDLANLYLGIIGAEPLGPGCASRRRDQPGGDLLRLGWVLRPGRPLRGLPGARGRPHLPQRPAPRRRAPLHARARADARRRVRQAGDLCLVVRGLRPDRRTGHARSRPVSPGSGAR